MIGHAVTVTAETRGPRRFSVDVNGRAKLSYVHEDAVATELHRLGADAPTSYDVIRRLAAGSRLVSIVLPASV